MLYRTLPGTELQLPAIGLGCWAIGGEQWGDDVDDASSIALIRGAKERGVDLFDTAPLYGRGHADGILREEIGRAHV